MDMNEEVNECFGGLVVFLHMAGLSMELKQATSALDGDGQHWLPPIREELLNHLDQVQLLQALRYIEPSREHGDLLRLYQKTAQDMRKEIAAKRPGEHEWVYLICILFQLSRDLRDQAEILSKFYRHKMLAGAV